MGMNFIFLLFQYYKKLLFYTHYKDVFTRNTNYKAMSHQLDKLCSLNLDVKLVAVWKDMIYKLNLNQLICQPLDDSVVRGKRFINQQLRGTIHQTDEKNPIKYVQCFFYLYFVYSVDNVKYLISSVIT